MDVKGIEELIEENKNLRIRCALRGAKLRVLRRLINSDKKYSNYNKRNLLIRLDKIKSLCNSMEAARIEDVRRLHFIYLGYEDNWEGG